MTEHVRTGYRRHRKATWAVVLGTLVAGALAVAIPALGQSTDSTTGVPPASGQGIYPSTVPVGGSNFSCASAGATYGGTATPSGMRQFQISNPVPGAYTDPATGVTFNVQAPSANLDSKKYLSFSVAGNAAVVYHAAIKGGTNSEWYDYFNNTPNTKAFPSGGVYADTDLHSTPDSKYSSTNYSFYAASIMTFCYTPLTVQPSCTSPFSGLGFGGTGGAVDYSAQLVAQNGACKSSNVVMYSYTPGTNQLFATLNPVTGGGTKYQVVEHIHWTGITGDSQNPITLKYDDVAPYDGVDTAGIAGNDGWRVMKLCGSDPRPNPVTDPFNLGGNTPAMPAADADGAHTSCMLQSTDSAGSGPNGRVYDAWVYSLVDGARGVT